MKHICLFSGGAASSVMSKMVADEFGKENTILLHTPTYAEHEDADRFREQVSKYIGIEITPQADGRSLWDLIKQYKAIPNNRQQFCTETLKLYQTNKFLKKFKKDEYIIYIGYGPSEWNRVQKAYARHTAKGRTVKFPLFEKKISSDEVKRIIRDEWRICLPEPYKYLQHNNCIPCFKGGKSYFYQIWKHYPIEFEMALQAEIDTGYTV